MELNKVHFCCHLGFVSKQSASNQRELLKKIKTSDPVRNLFATYNLGEPKSRKSIDTGENSRYEIGYESKGLSISVYPDQLAFCFNRTKSVTLDEKNIYKFVGEVLDLVKNQIKFDGFLLRGVGYLDDIPTGYLDTLQSYWFNKAPKGIGNFSELKFSEDLKIEEHPFIIKYRFKPVKLKKSKKELLRLSYDLLPQPIRSGFASSRLESIFNTLENEIYFNKMLESLPDA